MNFDEPFASAPVRYALDDVDSDEELETSLNMDKISVHAELVEQVPSKLTVLIASDEAGSTYIRSLNGGETLKTVGQITRKEEDKETKTSIYYLESKHILIIYFEQKIEQEEAGLYTRAIMSALASVIERVIILDSFTAVGYTSESWGEDLIPPFLRVLQTSVSPVVKGLTLFESPNMIKGLSAAIVTQCEIHSIPCYDLLSLQESIYGKLSITAEMLQAYDLGLKLLGLDISFNEGAMNTILSTRQKKESHHRMYL